MSTNFSTAEQPLGCVTPLLYARARARVTSRPTRTREDLAVASGWGDAMSTEEGNRKKRKRSASQSRPELDDSVSEPSARLTNTDLMW